MKFISIIEIQFLFFKIIKNLSINYFFSNLHNIDKIYFMIKNKNQI
jgi:hypothetical protein